MCHQTAKLQLQRKWASAKYLDVIKDVKEKRLHGLLVNAMLRFSKTAQMMVTLVVTASRGTASTVEAIYSSHQRDLLTWLYRQAAALQRGSGVS